MDTKYYYITPSGAQVGPVSLEQLRAAGIARNTPVWKPGMPQYRYASEFAELKDLFTSIPPIYQRPDTYLVWAILVTILCMPCGIPLGIIAIVKSAQVDSLWNRGDYNGAIKSSESARNWSIGVAIATVVVNGIGSIIYFLFFATLGLGSAIFSAGV